MIEKSLTSSLTRRLSPPSTTGNQICCEDLQDFSWQFHYSVLRTLVQPYLLGNDDEWSVPEFQYFPCPSSSEKERERWLLHNSSSDWSPLNADCQRKGVITATVPVWSLKFLDWAFFLNFSLFRSARTSYRASVRPVHPSTRPQQFFLS